MKDALNCKLKDYCLKKENILDDAWWEQFCSLWPLAPGPEFDRNQSHPQYDINSGPTRLTVEESNGLIALGVTIELVPLPGAMVVKMQDRYKWEHGVDPSLANIRDGTAVQLAIPDLGLMLINEVKVIEDCCTDHLQRELDEGWRLLAVCPPNAARRPDYVIGRSKPKD